MPRQSLTDVQRQTIHFPETDTNVVTTDNSDWATNCPEYNVTAVQVVRVKRAEGWQAQVHHTHGHTGDA